MTTISFDISGLEIWVPLLVGAQTVIATREEAADGIALQALLQQHDITILQGTPVLVAAAVRCRMAWQSEPPGLLWRRSHAA